MYSITSWLHNVSIADGGASPILLEGVLRALLVVTYRPGLTLALPRALGLT